MKTFIVHLEGGKEVEVEAATFTEDQFRYIFITDGSTGLKKDEQFFKRTSVVGICLKR
jgi:hypothetical protein